jgi:hypothetical protein
MNFTGGEYGKRRRDTLTRKTNDVDFDDEKEADKIELDNWLAMFLDMGSISHH